MRNLFSRRHVILSPAMVPALIASTGCDKSKSVPASVKKKAFKIVKALAKRLSKYTPGGMVAELVDLALEIKGVVEGNEEVVDTIYLTSDEAESLQNGGELEIEDADGKKHAVKLKGR
jgi:hypothetical protein